MYEDTNEVIGKLKRRGAKIGIVREGTQTTRTVTVSHLPVVGIKLNGMLDYMKGQGYKIIRDSYIRPGYRGLMHP